MQVVLRSDQPNLGKRGDIVDVADGYARNYLLPQGLAIIASPGIKAQAEAMRRARDARDYKARMGATELATRLAGASLEIGGNASHDGKLYGSVGVVEIIDALKGRFGVELDRKAIQLAEPLRELGDHEIVISLHAEVQVPITVVISE